MSFPEQLKEKKKLGEGKKEKFGEHWT